MGRARCEISVDGALAARAADWAAAFHADLAIDIDDRAVTLRSDRRVDAELRLIWQLALANEQLLERGRTRRHAVLAELLA